MTRRKLAIAPGLLMGLSLALALTGAKALAAPRDGHDTLFFSLPDSVGTVYLDTVSVPRPKVNNYWIVGIYGGVAMPRGYFNPSSSLKPFFRQPVVGLSFTKYFNMFGLFPNMGVEFGLQQNFEGYEYKRDKETGRLRYEYYSGAYRVCIKTYEAFALSHFHFDAGEHFKILAKVGFYAGYRAEIERDLHENYATDSTRLSRVRVFEPHELRPTYGVQGGAGFALMFSLFEVHVCAQVKWGWGYYMKPTYYDSYRYLFYSPLDAAFTVGLYYQLTPRHGRSRGMLRRMARQQVKEAFSQP